MPQTKLTALTSLRPLWFGLPASHIGGHAMLNGSVTSKLPFVRGMPGRECLIGGERAAPICKSPGNRLTVTLDHVVVLTSWLRLVR